MLNNEYVTVKLAHEHQREEGISEYSNIGVRDCSEDMHLLDVFTPDQVKSKWGTIYCSEDLLDKQKLHRSSQDAFPRKRIVFTIEYCDRLTLP